MSKKIDPLLLVGIRAVQRDVHLAQKAHDDFLAELFRRYELDPGKKYYFADDGTITELETIEQARTTVQKAFDTIEAHTNGSE